MELFCKYTKVFRCNVKNIYFFNKKDVNLPI